jgi:hypothetical protein
MKLSFVQENFGTLLVAFLFLRNGLLEIWLIWSRAATLDDLIASIPLLLAK